MITLVEALNYRCLRDIRQPLNRFHVFVGPNASGKTTFLDVIAFLSSLVSDGIDPAVGERTQNFQDLVWCRKRGGFELAIEAAIPADLLNGANNIPPDATKPYDTIRYEVSVGPSPEGEIGLSAETVLLKYAEESNGLTQRSLFPGHFKPRNTILIGPKSAKSQTVINKTFGGNDNFYTEVRTGKGKGWIPSFKLGPKRSALANLPEDESRFPASTWLKGLLADRIEQLILNSLLIRNASPPGRGKNFKPDGSNLPWVVSHLEKREPDQLKAWIAHLQTALPDIQSIRTVERKDDRHCYLMIGYQGGLEVPSWMVSDGTLRMLALTLPAYLPDLSGTYLIEEPENGIHPRAVEPVIQSLSSVYDAQIMMATHSPVILSSVELRDVLCFAKTSRGSTDVVIGTDHPALREWRGETNLGTLFAAGVLG